MHDPTGVIEHHLELHQVLIPVLLRVIRSGHTGKTRRVATAAEVQIRRIWYHSNK